MHGNPQALSIGKDETITIDSIESGTFSHLRELVEDEGRIILLACSTGAEEVGFCPKKGFYASENIAMALALSSRREVVAAVHSIEISSVQWKGGVAYIRDSVAGVEYRCSYKLAILR